MRVSKDPGGPSILGLPKIDKIDAQAGYSRLAMFGTHPLGTPHHEADLT